MSKSTVEPAVEQPLTEAQRQRSRHIITAWIRELALLPVIVLLLVIGAFVNPAFMTANNFINVAQQSAALGTVVVAETLILLTGKFDLSLQSTYGLAPMVGAWLIVSKDGQGLGTEWNPFIGIAIVLLVGLIVGTINGFLVIKLGFNAFIFTLAMLILLAGIQVGIVNGRTIYHLPDAYIYLGSQSFLGVPVSVWVTGVIFLCAALFLRYHRVGRAIYAIGGNTEAARAAGIQVDRIRISVFIVGGLLAALAGLMAAGQVVAVTANQGNNLIFSVFAAAVIGGISLDGGRGRMVGALTGVILLALVTNILVLSQIQTFWIDAATGLIILIALALARVIGTERG
ncbi:ABC transporter permease [Reticulibacter mediterranei]|uniref:Autoinducer 2 import system permease protein LsrC n=1 Tax=Reticulibacter mediterranei TaxID=2778369 RepID=A0A8J3IEI1_9CHLR|nr:ABC transporter permease [Reticulibacter mediterranei]GHO91048.1 ABC transporter permease [Reticulibacter mediterranei]